MGIICSVCMSYMYIDYLCLSSPNGHVTQQQRQYYVKTTLRRRFDAIMTLLLCRLVRSRRADLGVHNHVVKQRNNGSSYPQYMELDSPHRRAKCEMAAIFSRPQCVKLWTTGRRGIDFKSMIIKPIIGYIVLGNDCQIAPSWMPQNVTDGTLTLVQVMAWCRQETSHYLSQCWPRFMLPYGITRPQWRIIKIIPIKYCFVWSYWAPCTNMD